MYIYIHINAIKLITNSKIMFESSCTTTFFTTSFVFFPDISIINSDYLWDSIELLT